MRAKLRDSSQGQWPFDPAAFAEYLRCFRRPATIHASCVEGRPLASGHYLPEEVPAETVAELLRVLA